MVAFPTGRRGTGSGSSVRVRLVAASLASAVATLASASTGAADAGAGHVPGGVANADRTEVGEPVADAVATTAFVREVAPGHFVHVGHHEDMSAANGGDVATIGFVVGEASVAVIDPGGGSDVARALLGAVRERTSLPISHVVLTHFHPDHVLGAHVILAAADPAVVAHAHHVRAAVQRGAFYTDRYAALTDAGASIATPTLAIEPGTPLALDLGGRVLTVRAHATAHSDNDVSVLDRAAGVLWTGDLVVAGRTPSLDGSLVGWLEALDEIAALDARLIVPGHGEPGPPGPILRAQRGYLGALLDDTRARLAAGERLAEALAAAEAADPGTWRLFELHHPANVTRAWTELEWE